MLVSAGTGASQKTTTTSNIDTQQFGQAMDAAKSA
jgi:hypothetical protein